MISEINNFLIHKEKTITEIYREDTISEMIDNIIEKLQGLKKMSLVKRKEVDIEVTLFSIFRILEEKDS